MINAHKRKYLLALVSMGLIALVIACTAKVGETSAEDPVIPALSGEEFSLFPTEELSVEDPVIPALSEEELGLSFTEEQKKMKIAGLFVEWFDPGMEFDSVDVWYSGYEGLYIVRVGKKGGYNRYGVINKDGEIVAPIQYDYIYQFSNSIARVQYGKTMYIDTAGKEVPDYDENGNRLTPFEFEQVNLNGKAGLKDSVGNEILPCEYQIIGWFDNGLIWAGKEYDSGFSLFDSFGNKLNDIEYDYISRVTDAEWLAAFYYLDAAALLYAYKDGKWGIIDETGTVVIPLEYEGVLAWNDDVCAVCYNGKWGHMNFEGRIITPFQFDNAMTFSDGLAMVKKNGKWGYVDMQGNLVIPCEYDTAEYFFEGTASVLIIVDGMTYGYVIDKTGHRIIGPKDYKIFSWGNTYRGIYKDTSEEDYTLFALLDKEGNRLTEFSYSTINDFKEDLSVVSIYSNGGKESGLINQYGAEIIPLLLNSDFTTIDNDTCFIKTFQYGYPYRVGILELPADAATRKLPISERPITVYLDGLDLYFDTEPIIVNERTMVPMRKIFEMLDAEVSWDDREKKVTATTGNVKVELTIGSDTASINGAPTNLGTPALIENNRALVPLRFIAEALDCDVTWEAENRRVIISTDRS